MHAFAYSLLSHVIDETKLTGLSTAHRVVLQQRNAPARMLVLSAD